MSRILAHLVALLFVVAFAAPALAHVHGGMAIDRDGAARVTAPTFTPKVATPPVARAEIAAVSAGEPAPCDRDCGHRDGLGACVCMAACLAVTVSDTPSAALPALVTIERPGEAHPLRGAMHPPPVPPPRS